MVMLDRACLLRMRKTESMPQTKETDPFDSAEWVTRRSSSLSVCEGETTRVDRNAKQSAVDSLVFVWPAVERAVSIVVPVWRGVVVVVWMIFSAPALLLLHPLLLSPVPRASVWHQARSALGLR